jgi:starvation-inducible outer membrane lipoprotein
MNFKIKSIFVSLIFTLTACSSVPKGTLLGAGVGLGVGGAVASSHEDNSQKNASMAAFALIGGTLGYFLSNEKVKKERELKSVPNQKEYAPKLKRPEVRRVWVPDQISGDEFISGHWKYLIEKNAVWSKED